MDVNTPSNSRNHDVPLAEQAYQALKRSLIRCEFDPGQRLRVEELRRRYGLSSSPLREALNRLVQQGLVKSLDHRGFRAAPITVEAIRDLTRVRLLIESEALCDAMAHGDEQWEAGIVAAFHGLSAIEKRLSPGPVVLDENWAERHRAFHLSTYAACSSPLLLEMVEMLFDHGERFRRFSARHRTTRRGKLREHRDIRDAVIDRDRGRATSLLQAHIRATEQNVTACVSAMQSDRPGATREDTREASGPG